MVSVQVVFLTILLWEAAKLLAHMAAYVAHNISLAHTAP